MQKKLIKNLFSVTLIFMIFSSCKEKQKLSPDFINLQVAETSLQKETAELHYTNATGEIIVVFAYDYNDPAFTVPMIAEIEKVYGTAENGGLVLPLIFPDDFNGIISRLYDYAVKENIRGIIILGAPDYTYSAIIKIKSFWEDNEPVNIFSFFPKDSVTAQEATCDLILEYNYSSQEELDGIVTDLNKVIWEDAKTILLKAIKYMYNLPGKLPINSDLYYHIQNIAGKGNVHPFVVDSVLNSCNHYVFTKEN